MTTHVFRSLPFLADSRTKRNATIFASPESVTYTWEKQPGAGGSLANTPFPFSKQGSKVAKLLKFLFFLPWVAYIVLFKAKRGDVAVFMDLETALLGIPAARLKGVHAIFDIVDPCAQTKVRYPALQKLVDRVEVMVAGFANTVLLPHQIRSTYYSDRGLSTNNFPRTVVIENVPQFISHSEIAAPRFEGQIAIGYFGTLDRQSRGLEWLLDFVSKFPQRYRLVLAGNGALAEEMAGIAAKSENIEFHGIYSASDLVGLYQMVDFTWAYYSPKISLHKYAAPNKFYEHLYFARPIITSSIVPQFAKIRELKSGLAVDAVDFSDESFVKFDRAVTEYLQGERFDPASISLYWQTHYHDYYANAAADWQVSRNFNHTAHAPAAK